MRVTSYLVKLTTFDIIPTHLLEAEMYYFPDNGPLRSNFEQAGLESTLLLENIGFILWLILLHVFLVVAYLFIFKLNNRLT